MADKEKVRGRNPRVEHGKRIATARAFLRQAEALNKHEAKIAAHTAIQSWTNVISAVVATITTVALVAIAADQLGSSKRQERLDYARSVNQYAASLEYGRSEGLSSSEADEWSDPASDLPVRLKFERVRGESAITRVVVRQYAILLTVNQFFRGQNRRDEEVTYDFPTCEVLLDRWFRPTGEDFVVYDYLKAENHIVPGKTGPTVAVAGRTEIYVTYYDVFSELKMDRVTVTRDSTVVDRDVKTMTNDMDVVGVHVEDGQMTLGLSGDAIRSPACAEVLESPPARPAFLALPPPGS